METSGGSDGGAGDASSDKTLMSFSTIIDSSQVQNTSFGLTAEAMEKYIEKELDSEGVDHSMDEENNRDAGSWI